MSNGNRFVFIAPMYNASQYVGQMLHSICGQSYDNWKVLLIDDCSSQDEIEKENWIITGFKTLLQRLGQDPEKIQVVWNSEGRGKQWEVSNVLYGVSMCDDNDIISRIDADDWLTDLDALKIINALYDHSGADALWTAHRWGFTDRNISGPMPQAADPYSHPWVSSHFKTFKKVLLNGVPYQNFTNMNGELVKRAGDQAIYLPVLRNSKRRGFIPRVMYHYTIDEQGGQVYQSDDAKFQKSEADYIRTRGYVSSGPTWEEVLGV